MDVCRTSTSTLSAVSLRGRGLQADAMLPDLGFHNLILAPDAAEPVSQQPVIGAGQSPPEIARSAESDAPVAREGSGGIGERAPPAERATGADPRAGPPKALAARGSGHLLRGVWWPSVTQENAAAGTLAQVARGARLPTEATAGADGTEFSDRTAPSVPSVEDGAGAPAMGFAAPQQRAPVAVLPDQATGAPSPGPDALADRVRAAPRLARADPPPPEEISARVAAIPPGSGARLERQVALAHPGVPRPGEAQGQGRAPDRSAAGLAALADLPIRAGPAMSATLLPLSERPVGPGMMPRGVPERAVSELTPLGDHWLMTAPVREETTRPLWVQLPGRVPVGRLAAELHALVIEHMRPAGQSLFQIRMDPVELGQLRITLQMTEAGLHIQIMAERPETLDLMRRFSADLMQDLRQMGFSDLMMSFSDQGERAPPPAPERRAFVLAGDAPNAIQIPGSGSAGRRAETAGMDLRL